MKTVDSKIKEAKEYGQRKDDRRKKQIGYVERALEQVKKNVETDPKAFEIDIHNEMENSLLRMAEARVEAEMRIEDLTEEVKKKDEEILKLKEQIEEKDQRLQGKEIQI